MFSLKTFSLQRFFGRQDAFFGLFEKSIDEACACAAALRPMVREPHVAQNLITIQERRSQNKRYLDQVSELSIKTFVTALDREDIETLAEVFYKIPKPMEKFAERFSFMHSYVAKFSFDPQIETINYSIQRVKQMLAILKEGSDIEAARKLNAELQVAEAKADHLVSDLLRSLLEKKVDASQIIILRDLYDLLERAIDRCRDAGNELLHICLKYS